MHFHFCDFAFSKPDMAIAGRVTSAHNFKERCLAGPVWPDKPKNFMVLNMQIDALQHWSFAKGDVHPPAATDALCFRDSHFALDLNDYIHQAGWKSVSLNGDGAMILCASSCTWKNK